MAIREWLRVRMADECMPCPDCKEPWCPSCQKHYDECSCPSPNQEDEYDYKEVGGVLMAARKRAEDCPPGG